MNPSSSQWFSTKKSGLRYATVTPVDTCVVHTAPRKFQEPSLTSSENLGDSNAREWSEGSRQELAAVGGHPERGHPERGHPEGHADDDDSADNSENTECVSVHSEESGESEREESVYECRHCPLDMGNGDTAIGYKE